MANGTYGTIHDDPEAQLKRRARRFARDREYRKASLVLQELAFVRGDASSWVALGAMLLRARRYEESLSALRQGLFLHRKAGAPLRARTVARMILEIEPSDSNALRMSSLRAA